jgi:hypothetical protein
MNKLVYVVASIVVLATSPAVAAAARASALLVEPQIAFSNKSLQAAYDSVRF